MGDGWLPPCRRSPVLGQLDRRPGEALVVDAGMLVEPVVLRRQDAFANCQDLARLSGIRRISPYSASSRPSGSRPKRDLPADVPRLLGRRRVGSRYR